MAQDNEDGKGLKLEKSQSFHVCMDMIYSKSLQNFRWIAFTGKIHLIFSLSAKF